MLIYIKTVTPRGTSRKPSSSSSTKPRSSRSAPSAVADDGAHYASAAQWVAYLQSVLEEEGGERQR